MQKKEISPQDLTGNVYDIWKNRWFLLTCGDYNSEQFNTMTVAWGSFGCMWNKPFAQVVVRPSRYTHEFTEKFDSFTLCSFPENQKETLQYLGSVSGRDEDKIIRSGLTPIAAQKTASPVFEEADLVIECRKMYYDTMKPANFLDSTIEKNYSGSDYHTVYFGEILRIAGDRDFSSRV